MHFNFSFDAYVLLKAAGIIWFLFAGTFALRRFPLSLTQRLLFISAIILSGFIGSKFWYILQHAFGREPYPYDDFMAAWNDAGSVLYGWILGGSAAAWLGAQLLSLRALPLFDALLPHFLIAQILNRLGCFAAGCCWGSGPCHLPWAVANEMMPGMKIHPVQLYEAIWDLLLLLYLSSPRKWGSRTSSWIPACAGMTEKAAGIAGWPSDGQGRVTLTYFIGYASGRLILEYFRGDNGPAWAGLTVPQVTSCIIIVFALLIYLRAENSRPRP